MTDVRIIATTFPGAQQQSIQQAESLMEAEFHIQLDENGTTVSRLS